MHTGTHFAFINVYEFCEAVDMYALWWIYPHMDKYVTFII